MVPGSAPQMDATQSAYRLLVESVQDCAIVLLDAHGQIRSWNPGAALLTSYTPPEAIGQLFHILYTSDDQAAGLPQRHLRAATQAPLTLEGWRRRRDGEPFWAQVTICPLIEPATGLQGFSLSFRDLTAQQQIAQDHERMRQKLAIIHQTARIGTWEVDLIADSCTWSPTTYDIYGLSDDYQPAVASWIGFYREGDSRDIMRSVYRDACTSGSPFDIELPVITADGREIWCRTIGHAEFRDGRCARVYGTVQDIDMQKRTQIELQVSEERFRNSFDHSGIGMAIVSLDAVPIRVNKRLCEILGYTHSEFYQLSMLDITHPDDRAHDTALAKQLLDGEIEYYHMTKRYYHKNGHIVWANLNVSLVRDSNKKPLHFVSEVEDISDTKKAEDELRRVNDELTAIFNSGTRVSIIGTDMDGLITHFNKGAEAMLGYTAGEMIGRTTPELIHVADEIARRGEELRAEYGREIQGFDIFVEKARRDMVDAREWTYVRKDGSRIPVQLVVSAIKDDQNKIVGYLGIATDISQIKEAEASILKYALLEAKNKEMEAFTFLASHDLLEPLQTVSSFVDLLAEEYHDQLDENGAKYISFISGSTRRMMELVKGLLHYSRLGKERLLRKTDLNVLVQEVIEDLGLLIADTHAKINVSPLPVMNIYPLEFKQLMQHLISNAIKFRKQDVAPQIRVSVRAVNNIWLFVVEDNGIGIADRNREKIFALFQRLHDRHEYEGTGIGLAYCKKIVEMHNGTIWVDSIPNAGSTFCFTIMT